MTRWSIQYDFASGTFRHLTRQYTWKSSCTLRNSSTIVIKSLYLNFLESFSKTFLDPDKNTRFKTFRKGQFSKSGSTNCPVESQGWKVKSGKILMILNRHYPLVGSDMFPIIKTHQWRSNIKVSPHLACLNYASTNMNCEKFPKLNYANSANHGTMLLGPSARADLSQNAKKEQNSDSHRISSSSTKIKSSCRRTFWTTGKSFTYKSHFAWR